MAKGFDSARQAFAEIEARKNSGGGPKGLYLKLPKSGDQAVVRFAFKEADWAWAHELPKTDGQAYSKKEICRDQDPENGTRTGEYCEGCDKDYPRKMFASIPLIWRDAPVFEKVEENGQEKTNYENVVGHEDQVAHWTVGKVVLEELDGNAATYKDLTTRDFVVTRKGTGLSTTYDIKPMVDDNGDPIKAPLSAADKKLLEEVEQPDYTPPSAEEWGKKTGKKGSSAPASTDVSPFKRRAAAEE